MRRTAAVAAALCGILFAVGMIVVSDNREDFIIRTGSEYTFELDYLCYTNDGEGHVFADFGIVTDYDAGERYARFLKPVPDGETGAYRFVNTSKSAVNTVPERRLRERTALRELTPEEDEALRNMIGMPERFEDVYYVLFERAELEKVFVNAKIAHNDIVFTGLAGKPAEQ